MTTSTLTRLQAHDLIADTVADLRDLFNPDYPIAPYPECALMRLHRHWIGHSDTVPGDTMLGIVELLGEYVDEAANAGIDVRTGHGPKDSDDTGLTAPSDWG